MKISRNKNCTKIKYNCGCEFVGSKWREYFEGKTARKPKASGGWFNTERKYIKLKQ